MTTPTYNYETVGAALNRAANDIIEVASLPDTGAIDAMNLLVNACLYYLQNPEATLDQAVDASYGNEAKLSDIVEWMHGR